MVRLKQTQFGNFMKNLSSAFLIFFFLSSPVLPINGWIPVDDTEIKLSDGRKIIAERSGPNSHKIILMRQKKIIWQNNFEQEYERLWDYAFFVPLKKGRYSSDLNKDGLLEVAIGTWDGGNNMANRTVLIFTVKKESLEYYATEKFNLEFGKYVYP